VLGKGADGFPVCYRTDAAVCQPLHSMSADGGQCTQLWATLCLGPDRSAMGIGTDNDHRVDYRSDPLGRLSDMRLGMTLGLVGYFTFPVRAPIR
jgi:hypothetical protein